MINVISHIRPVVHGSSKYPPGIALWIDEKNSVAHLISRSGSPNSRKNRHIPDQCPYWHLDARKGFLWAPTTEDIEDIRLHLQDAILAASLAPSYHQERDKRIKAVLQTTYLEDMPCCKSR